ncbi:MAG TPA: threonine--tRNA ligase [Aggregatilineaceae bacterium]|nr:threonine--tRNA ligase [Aggregatilineaceae bacterium]
MNRYQDSQLYRIRHSASHVMAQAVLEKFPDAKIAIGPPIEDGFYYDFELPRPLTEEDLQEIEQRMRQIIREGHEFVRKEVSADDARHIFHDQPYKLELIDGLEQGGADEYGEKTSDPVVISTYQHDTFEDLCRGPHVKNTREINPDAVSITFKPPAGAYWRGDEHREMLTRIYGTAWESAQQLEEYLALLEESRKRDHRVIGPALGLFTFNPLVGKGLPLWKPNGAVLRDLLERFLREVQLERGYQPVLTPHIARVALYEKSGHYPYYKDSQYAPFEVEGDLFMLKPMNCPHHIHIYKDDLHSYRDLPIRMAEFGTVYRYEKSGELHGLTRVRGFTQDDAHIFCTPEQLEEEFLKVADLVEFILNSLGLTDYRARVGVRDPHSDKYVGDHARWEQATQAIIAAANKRGLTYTVEEGEAAFYGPKLDYIIRDVLKREWQISTIQVDYNLPARFELEYVGEDNERHQPIMIHRALYGSMERFVAVLIEHFAGAFPAWLQPVQVMMIPVADRHLDYARQVAAELHQHGLRVKVDDSEGRMGGKIREATLQKIPWMLVVGDRDAANHAVSVRLRSGEDLGAMPTADFLAYAQRIVDSKALELH